jgi:hypothetical protein
MCDSDWNPQVNMIDYNVLSPLTDTTRVERSASHREGTPYRADQGRQGEPVLTRYHDVIDVGFR